MTQHALRILIVEDEFLASEQIRESCERLGYTVVEDAANGEEAVEMTARLKPDVVLMDIEMPHLNGLEAARLIQERAPTAIVVLSAHQSHDRVEKACQYGIGAYLLKPPKARELERAVSIALARFRDLQALRRLNARLEAEIEERRQVQAELEEYSNRLEEMVETRTQALRISEAQYRALAAKMAVGLAIFQHGRFVFSNPALTAIFGYTAEELEQMDSVELARDDYTRRVREKIQAERDGEVDEHPWQVPCLRADGEEIWVEVRRSAIEWEQQSAVLLAFRDITAQKQEELALQQD